jgi:hypothetical protein
MGGAGSAGGMPALGHPREPQDWILPTGNTLTWVIGFYRDEIDDPVGLSLALRRPHAGAARDLYRGARHHIQTVLGLVPGLHLEENHNGRFESLLPPGSPSLPDWPKDHRQKGGNNQSAAR